LNHALHVAWHRPLKGDEPVPELITANGRKWIHFDGTDGHFGVTAFESYGTLIDPTTVFFVFASYWENLRKDPAWFQSRRDLLRRIRDQVVIAQ
jgi:hypothetical protein